MGCFCQERPAFLKLPMSFFFLVSMLMTGVLERLSHLDDVMELAVAFLWRRRTYA